jgi:hypothetical protein
LTERIDIQRLRISHPRLGQFKRILGIGGKKNLERRAIPDLREETARRSDADLDIRSARFLGKTGIELVDARGKVGSGGDIQGLRRHRVGKR